MNISQLDTKTDPTKVYVLCRNDGTVAMTAGMPVVWQMDGTRNGIDIVTSKEGAAASDPLLVGIADEAMVIGSADTTLGYGLVQVYGYDDDAIVMQHGTATNGAAVVGDLMYVRTDGGSGGALSCMRPGTTLWTISSNAAASVPVHLGRIVACSAHASTGTSTITGTSKVFLRMM